VPLGFVLNPPHNTISLAPERVLRVVRKAFEMRADGATIEEVRTYLAEHGHARAYRAIQRMLHSPLYIGEIRYGGKAKDDGTVTPLYVNTSPGFDPVVDRDIWDAVQAMTSPAGRYSKSERLLARQDVVHCGGCGAKMIVGTTKSGLSYYRCGRGKNNGCPKRATIMAVPVEDIAEKVTMGILNDAEDQALVVQEAHDARDAADRAIAKRTRARILLIDDDKKPDDEAQAILDRLEVEVTQTAAIAKELEDRCPKVKMINAARDWKSMSVAARQILIKQTLRSIEIRPGRGGTPIDRCTIHRFGRSLSAQETARLYRFGCDLGEQETARLAA
jgi:hypothetical protein